MNARFAHNLIAWLLVLLILAVMVTCSGCAYYSVTKTATETKARAITWRDSEAPFINVTAEDGNIKEFTFSAESIDNPGLDDVGDALGVVMDFCKKNPAMCSP